MRKRIPNWGINRHSFQSFDLKQDRTAARIETPEATLIIKTDAARPETAIAGLPYPFRETVLLGEAHELSYQEIAKVTEVPIGTVMSRLARGHYRLIAAIGIETPTELHHDSAAIPLRRLTACPSP
jgi:DNA-directed RNA polymerase specialized sigma24 family protein